MGRHLKKINKHYSNQSGATIVFVALCIFVIISFAALALDISHLAVTKNELQNAADAGALAGAHKLYSNDGRVITHDVARQAAIAVSTMNQSDNVPADVETEDVLIGHWSFGIGSLPKGFTVSTSTDPVPLWGVDTVTLDENPDFINAVQVTAWRKEPRVTSWFARIFGYEDFLQSAAAVAYIGFSGSVEPETIDQPIAICKESLLQNSANGSKWECNIGRMLNSSDNDTTSNTGAWTNFTQDPCETASVPTMRPLICGNGNPFPVNFGIGIGATGGVQDNIFRDFADCWSPRHTQDNFPSTGGDGLPDTVWTGLKLPVVKCPGNNVSTCPEVVGVVVVDVIWVERNGDLSKIDDNAPKYMEDPGGGPSWPQNGDKNLAGLSEWHVGRNAGDLFPTQEELDTNYSNPWENGKVRWASFVKRFNLLNADNQPAPWQHKAIYFMPNCDYHEPDGDSTGENFGVLAVVPVLVD